MKISGRNLRRRLQLLGNRLSRAKHYRGYGVHSPFVYGVVRKVFMRKSLFEGSGLEPYDSLRVEGLSERTSRQLHNLYVYVEAKSFAINSVGGELSILLENYPTERLNEAYAEAKKGAVTLVVCQPYANRERQNAVKALLEEHTSTTIDNRAYIIFFNNYLPKQHYCL